MRNKTRKHIWPVSLVMSIAIIGALAAFLVLANNPGATMAHGDADHDAACAAMTDEQQKAHNAEAILEGEEVCARRQRPGNGNGNGDETTPWHDAQKQQHFGRRWCQAHPDHRSG